MPKTNESKENLEEILKFNERYAQMEPPNSIKDRLIIAGPNSPTQVLSSVGQKFNTFDT